MLRLQKFFSLLCLASLTSPLAAVSVNSGAIENKNIYGIEFPGDARSYYGSEKQIQSISTQEYITANFRVTELNIVTQSSALLRIYYSRPLRIGELQKALADGGKASGIPGGSSIIQRPLPAQVQAMADRASGAGDAITGTEVIKEYPSATHAHTIEYRIGSREELLELHDELKKHWLKEAAYYEDGQIVDADEATSTEMKPRHLGGTLFTVQEP